ncbi:restriction endonuclease [Polyangium jinanense]|uniref:restriction endonuclease n=1 Tax=Polyangium jinanense TaxID=2829994 RepID=UPI0023420328|nr:restriction endonuclease [Polyangium jinanense]MDC3960935.1 restriction endonuclease [Polyangium jinanense]
MIPKQSQIELPLLQVLARFPGGEAKPSDVYPLLEKRFPNLTKEDLVEQLESGSSKWTNRVQWVRQSLITKGEMSSPRRGVWAITDQGRARLAANNSGAGTEPANPLNLMALQDEYLTQFKDNLLERLIALTPEQFEHFAKKLLEAYGFLDMKVTTVSHDGGIDGHGLLKVGLATMNVAFQCKRWQTSVPRPEVDKFRGAIQGEFEQGLFFTTSEFTEGAKGASVKRGAVPIILLDGESIVGLMIEKQFGVRRKPLELYFDEVDRLFVDRD